MTGAQTSELWIEFEQACLLACSVGSVGEGGEGLTKRAIEFMCLELARSIWVHDTYPTQRLGKAGRSGEIRTPDPLLPKQVRYQAALHSGWLKGTYIDVSAKARNKGLGTEARSDRTKTACVAPSFRCC